VKKPTPILHTLAGGGSGTGFSFYESCHGCLRSRALYNQAREDGRTFIDEGGPLTIGTIFHAFMEMLYKRALPEKTDPIAVRFSDVVDEQARFEAERLFRAWRERYPSPLEFGKVLEVEEVHPPENKMEAVGLAVGVTPFQFKPDLVSKMTAADVKRLYQTHEVVGAKLTPGRWIVDHKTDGRRMSTFVDEALSDHRFHAYTQGWNAAYPRTPVNGVIRNTWFKYKEPKGVLVVVPKPTERQVRSLHTFMDWSVKMLEFGDAPIPSKKNCFAWGRPCRWLAEGVCSQC